MRYLFIFIFFISCGKTFEEDPKRMKLFASYTRLKGEWHISKITINGKDSTSLIFNSGIPTYYKFKEYDDLKSHEANVRSEFSSEYKDLTFIDSNGIVQDANVKYAVWTEDKFYLISTHPNIAINQGYFKSHGALGEFRFDGSSPYATWYIKKLTFKEFKIVSSYRQNYYEVQFEKI